MGEEVLERHPHCMRQEMEHKFLNSKILHLVYILVPSPHDYTSTDVRNKQPKSLRSKVLQQGKEDRCKMCPQTTSEAGLLKEAQEYESHYSQICPYTGYTQKNCAVSKLNKKFISHLTRAQRTPSAAATAQVSHALPAVRFSCLLRGQFLRWRRSRKGRSVCSVLRCPVL